jgi:hypothetical protein
VVVFLLQPRGGNPCGHFPQVTTSHCQPPPPQGWRVGVAQLLPQHHGQHLRAQLLPPPQPGDFAERAAGHRAVQQASPHQDQGARGTWSNPAHRPGQPLPRLAAQVEGGGEQPGGELVYLYVIPRSLLHRGDPEQLLPARWPPPSTLQPAASTLHPPPSPAPGQAAARPRTCWSPSACPAPRRTATSMAASRSRSTT